MKTKSFFVYLHWYINEFNDIHYTMTYYYTYYSMYDSDQLNKYTNKETKYLLYTRLTSKAFKAFKVHLK